MFVADYRDRGHASASSTNGTSEASFVEHQDNMVKALKNISRGAQDMVQQLHFYYYLSPPSLPRY